MSIAYTVLDVIHKSVSVFAVCIAIFVYFTKKKEIKSVFKILVNYASQQSLGEIRSKIDRLNDLSFNDPTHKDEILKLLNEIVGQIKGNKELSKHCQDVLGPISELSTNRKMMLETVKRSTISQLREMLKHYECINLEEIGD